MNWYSHLTSPNVNEIHHSRVPHVISNRLSIVGDIFHLKNKTTAQAYHRCLPIMCVWKKYEQISGQFVGELNLNVIWTFQPEMNDNWLSSKRASVHCFSEIFHKSILLISACVGFWFTISNASQIPQTFQEDIPLSLCWFFLYYQWFNRVALHDDLKYHSQIHISNQPKIKSQIGDFIKNTWRLSKL